MKLYAKSYRFLKLSSRQFEYLRAPTIRIRAMLNNHLGRHYLARLEISQALKLLKTSSNLLEYAQALMNAASIFKEEAYARDAKFIFDKCGVKRY